MRIDSEVLLLSHLPRKYAFIFTDNRIVHHDAEQGWPATLSLDRFDALLVVDTGTWSQLPGLKERIATWNVPKLVLDHHLTQEDWADLMRGVDLSAEHIALPAHARRGAVIKSEPGKTKISIRLDNRVLDYFRSIADAAGGGSYQTLINDALLAHIQQKSMLEAVRQVVREEVARTAAVGQKARRQRQARARRAETVG